MIFSYDDRGFITHITYDPVPQGLIDVLTAKGSQFINMPPIPLPAEPIEVTNEEGETVIEMRSPGAEVVEIDPLLDWYNIEADAVEDRPVFELPERLELAVGESKTFTGLPDPCTVRLFGTVTEVSGGALELAGEAPATYTLIVAAWPYREHRMEVVVK